MAYRNFSSAPRVARCLQKFWDVPYYTERGIFTFPDVHTPYLELVRLIKYRVSIGKWNLYYCHVVPIACPINIFT